MYYSDLIELGEISDESLEGYPGKQKFVRRKFCYADKQSAARSEFYKAQSVGKTVTAVFSVHSEDYHGETAIRWCGSYYNVERSYERGTEISLTCTDLDIITGV